MVLEAAVPSRAQQGCILMLAAALVAVGVAGGQWFMESDYVNYGYLEISYWTVDSGYTTSQFWGLVLQTLCLPAATVALMSFALHSYKSPAWPSWLKANTYLCLLVLLVACAFIADSTMTDGLVGCLWSLCQDVGISSSTTDDDAFSAFIPATGTMYFCVLIMFACMAGLLLVRTSLDLVPSGSCCWADKRGQGWGIIDSGTKGESQPLMEGHRISATTGTYHGGGDGFVGGRGSNGIYGTAAAGVSTEADGFFGTREISSMSSSMVDGESLEQERRRVRRLMSLLWLVGVLCLFFPLFIFASTSVGDSWEHMTASDVKSYVSSSATEAYGPIWNIRVTSTLVLKLFPDILIYWAFTYLVIVVALVARRWRPLRRFFHGHFRPFGKRPHPWRVPPPPPRESHEREGEGGILSAVWGAFCRRSSPVGRKNGEVFLAAVFFVLLLCEGLFWYYDHGWGASDIDSKTWQERFGRTMGQLANITMGLLILPVSRNGIFEEVFGIGWEAMVAFHRRMSRVFLALVLVHMVFFWVVYAQNDDFWHDWPIAIPTAYHEDNWTIPLATLTTWVMVIAMFGLSVEWVRRKHFEVFYYSHHFFLVVWAMMLWHAASAWYYMGASIALWLVDRAIRFSKGLTIVSVKGLSTAGGITRLAFTVESGGIGPWGGTPRAMLHEAGQYVFLNVPAISLLEWHPFTISSRPDDRETTLHIKDMGPDTFTEKFRILATLGSHFQINVDGPYGFPLEYHQYRLLVLVAGGVGVTPCISILRHLSLLARTGGLPNYCLDEGVRLIWTSRSAEEMVMLEAELQDAVGKGMGDPLDGGRFSVHLHVTTPPGLGVTSAAMSMPVTEGRPDLCSYLQRFGREVIFPPGNHQEHHDHHHQQWQQRVKGEGLVFACGPKGLVRDASAAAEAAGMSFHAETFEL